jgi:hypothetical protein
VEAKDGQKVVDSIDTFFGSLDFLVCTSDTSVSTPTIGVTVGGGTVSSSILQATVSHGIEQTSGQAQLVFDSRPNSATEGDAVTVSMNSTSVFAGTVTGRSWDHYPTGVGVDCRDRMEYLTYPYGGTERTYTAQTIGTVWQNLVEAMGVANANTSIEDSGWTVGVIQSLIFRKGDKFLPFIRESTMLAGYVAFTKGVDSAFFIRPLQYGVTGASTITLTEGVNILSAHREISRDGIYNGVQVDGLTTSDFGSVSVFSSTANSDVRDPPGTVSMQVQSNLIESDSRGTTVALELISQHNFKPESGRLVLPGTAIEPMDVLIVTHSDLEWSGATVVAAQVEHHFASDGYTTTVQAKRIR